MYFSVCNAKTSEKVSTAGVETSTLSNNVAITATVEISSLPLTSVTVGRTTSRSKARFHIEVTLPLVIGCVLLLLAVVLVIIIVWYCKRKPNKGKKGEKQVNPLDSNF